MPAIFSVLLVAFIIAFDLFVLFILADKIAKLILGECDGDL